MKTPYDVYIVFHVSGWVEGLYDSKEAVEKYYKAYEIVWDETEMFDSEIQSKTTGEREYVIKLEMVRVN